jgi:hypothetical protein
MWGSKWTILICNFLIYNNYDLIYDGTTFTTLASTSYFTNDEITNMKSFISLVYNNNDAQDILTELYLVEQYLLFQKCVQY